jgi:hypothetical protein
MQWQVPPTSTVDEQCDDIEVVHGRVEYRQVKTRIVEGSFWPIPWIVRRNIVTHFDDVERSEKSAEPKKCGLLQLAGIAPTSDEIGFLSVSGSPTNCI